MSFCSVMIHGNVYAATTNGVICSCGGVRHNRLKRLLAAVTLAAVSLGPHRVVGLRAPATGGEPLLLSGATKVLGSKLGVGHLESGKRFLGVDVGLDELRHHGSDELRHHGKLVIGLAALRHNGSGLTQENASVLPATMVVKDDPSRLPGASTMEDVATAAAWGETPINVSDNAVLQVHSPWWATNHASRHNLGWGNQTWNDTWYDIMLALGSSGGSVQDVRNNNKLRREMCYQHIAASILILLVFMAFIATSLSIVYWQVANRARETASIRYYADLGTEVGLGESDDAQDFLNTFGRAPTNTRLSITGLEAMTASEMVRGNSECTMWRGDLYRIAFSFALDLSSWSMQTTDAGAGSGGAGTVSAEDLEDLSKFLASNANDLAVVEVQKEVTWDGWEELATNIKSRLRQRGFTGFTHVSYDASESVLVRKNKTWAHFLRNRLTRGLVALSLICWPLHELYIWARSAKLVVRCRHQIDIPIGEYWRLVGDKLTAEGFAEAPEQLPLAVPELRDDVGSRSSTGPLGVAAGAPAS